MSYGLQHTYNDYKHTILGRALVDECEGTFTAMVSLGEGTFPYEFSILCILSSFCSLFQSRRKSVGSKCQSSRPATCSLTQERSGSVSWQQERAPPDTSSIGRETDATTCVYYISFYILLLLFLTSIRFKTLFEGNGL